MGTTNKKRDSSLLSYHTFIFPFSWDKKKTNKADQTFEDMLEDSNNEFWHRQKLDRNCLPERGESQDLEEYEKDWYLAYKCSQYFNKPAKRLIFDFPKGKENKSQNEDENWIVKNYILRPYSKNIQGNSKYIIKKSNDKFTEEFVLSVNRIRLRLYSTGSALMIFDMEYSGEKYLTRIKKPRCGTRHHGIRWRRHRGIPKKSARWRSSRIKTSDRSLDAVNKINEYGRRVTFPYLQKSGHPSIVADSVELHIDILENEKQRVFPIRESFLERHRRKREEFDAWKKASDTRDSVENDTCSSYTKEFSPNYIFEPIMKLLNLANDEAGSPSEQADDWKIRPLIDDRMLVCCLLLRPDLFGNISEWNPFIAEYRYLSDCNRYDYGVSSELYKFVFIEENYPMCMSHSMRKHLLRESVYDRWIDYNTIYAATDHSFVAAHTTEEFYLPDNFLHLYIEMFLIVLIQRATLLALSSEASSIAGKLTPKNSKSLKNALKAISELHKEYIRTDNQMLLTEVTSQEQGIEMYELFLKQLYIEKHKQALGQQLNNLYEVSNIESNRMQQRADTKLQSMLRVLTYAGLFLAMLGLFPFVSGAYPGESLGSYTDISHMLGVISAVLLAGIAYWRVSQDKAPKK